MLIDGGFGRLHRIFSLDKAGGLSNPWNCYFNCLMASQMLEEIQMEKTNQGRREEHTNIEKDHMRIPQRDHLNSKERDGLRRSHPLAS